MCEGKAINVSFRTNLFDVVGFESGFCASVCVRFYYTFAGCVHSSHSNRSDSTYESYNLNTCAHWTVCEGMCSSQE